MEVKPKEINHFHHIILPKSVNLLEHLSMVEEMGIDVDIDEAKRVIQTLTNEGFVWSTNFKSIKNENSGFMFVLKIVKEMELYLFTTFGSGCGKEYSIQSQCIRNISKELIRHKRLMYEIIQENRGK